MPLYETHKRTNESERNFNRTPTKPSLAKRAKKTSPSLSLTHSIEIGNEIQPPQHHKTTQISKRRPEVHLEWRTSIPNQHQTLIVFNLCPTWLCKESDR